MTAKRFDLVDFTKKYKGDLHEFFLDMRSWKKFKTKIQLNWQKTRFDEANLASIPKERGIYTFTIELSPAKLPPHGYILYVGITGDISDANLYKRYNQYLLKLKSDDGRRPAVSYMLWNWRNHLFFNFVPLPNKKVDLAKIERAFINSVMPPVNQMDFTAEIQAARTAAF
jgi:hypothetical protein